MNVLLCEGKNDAHFFAETMKVRFNSVYTIFNNDLSRLQEMFGIEYKFTKEHFPLIIYGDGGKPSIINKVLRRIVVDTLGKNDDGLDIIMVLNEDDSDYEKLKESIYRELESLSENTLKSTHLPTLKKDEDSFILKHPDSDGILKVKLATVPRSLEEQVVKKTVELKCPHNHQILRNKPHEALELLANKYYDGCTDVLVRNSFALLREEIWVNNVYSIMN